jgi:hypothetical protein
MPWNIIMGPILFALILGVRKGLAYKKRKTFNREMARRGW